MPYSVDNPPEKVKKKISDPKKQRQWVHVFNSILSRTGSEERAFAGAWSTAQKSITDVDEFVDNYLAMDEFVEKYAKQAIEETASEALGTEVEVTDL